MSSTSTLSASLNAVLARLNLLLPRQTALSRSDALLAGLATGTLYMLLCQALRFHRLRRKLRRWGHFKTRQDFAKMTNNDAYEILRDLPSLEFPEFFKTSLDFALFRTYGIPTISKLLRKTNQLSGEETSSKRIADTAVLISEFTTNHPESQRHNEAISRMNYIHGVYQKAGHISNEDMMYTLALFVLEPPSWISRYEWRKFTDLEKCAAGTFWKAIGDAMGISWADLPSGPDRFHDGLHWFEEVAVWAEEYEKKAMVPDQNNHEVAERTTAYLLENLPNFLKPVGKNMIFSVMDARLRRAMLYPDPPAAYPVFVNSFLQMRRFYLRHFALPRIFKQRGVSKDADPRTGRYNLLLPLDQPWYIKPTLANRFSLFAWYAWAVGKPYPGSDPKYQPEGYHIHEIGPKSMSGRGLTEYAEVRDQLMSQNRGGCPFAFSKIG